MKDCMLLDSLGLPRLRHVAIDLLHGLTLGFGHILPSEGDEEPEEGDEHEEGVLPECVLNNAS